MKKYANSKRREEEFAVGDKIFLKLRPCRQKSLVSCSNKKLAARFYGPYTVLQMIGAVAYKLELPSNATIHPVFHVSQLRHAKGFSHSFILLPPQLVVDLELVVEPESLLEVRPQQNAAHGKLEVLIKWKNLPLFEATWEDYDSLNSQFPAFHLEDKVNAWGGSMDKPLIRFMCARRKNSK